MRNKVVVWSDALKLEIDFVCLREKDEEIFLAKSQRIKSRKVVYVEFFRAFYLFFVPLREINLGLVL